MIRNAVVTASACILHPNSILQVVRVKTLKLWQSMSRAQMQNWKVACLIEFWMHLVDVCSWWYFCFFFFKTSSDDNIHISSLWENV